MSASLAIAAADLKGTGRMRSVARAYDALLHADRPPTLAALQGWQQLADDCVERAAGIRLLLDVEETDLSEPYESAEEMCEHIAAGHLHVSTANCEHPVWTPAQNVAFRIVHDVLGHYAASVAAGFQVHDSAYGTLRNHPDSQEAEAVAGFDWEGEIAACVAHVALLPTLRARQALFTECLGQTAHVIEFGQFPPQRIGFLGDYITSPDPVACAYSAFIH